MKLAYRLYQLPADDRPLTCWELFQMCRNGEYTRASETIRVVELLIEASATPQESFDKLVDGMR